MTMQLVRFIIRVKTLEQRVDRGDNNKIRVAVAVSKGTQMISVPEVKGYSEAEAKNMLTDLGFQVHEIQEASSSDDGIEREIVSEPTRHMVQN